MQQAPWTPLAEAIAPHVGKTFAELPDELRQRIHQRGSWLARWDDVEPERRLTVAQQSDVSSNPALQGALEARADFFTGFWEPSTPEGRGRVRYWLNLRSVAANEAARLLCGDDPIERPQGRTPAPLDAAFNLLHRAFCKAEQNGRARSLRDWIALAQAVGLEHLGSVEDWAACSAVSAGESKPPAPEDGLVGTLCASMTA